MLRTQPSACSLWRILRALLFTSYDVSLSMCLNEYNFDYIVVCYRRTRGAFKPRRRARNERGRVLRFTFETFANNRLCARAPTGIIALEKTIVARARGPGASTFYTNSVTNRTDELTPAKRSFRREVSAPTTRCLCPRDTRMRHCIPIRLEPTAHRARVGGHES